MKNFSGLIILGAACAIFPAYAQAQDAMQFGVSHLKIVAEDDKARILRYAPHKGDSTPMHSHPEQVVYVVKGGRVHYSFPDGTAKDVELKTGDVLIRPPVTHADEALDDVEVLLVELKK